MSEAIGSILFLTLVLYLISTFFGIYEIINYSIENHKYKHKKVLVILIGIIFIVILFFLFDLICFVVKLLSSDEITYYIGVLIYTILLALYSSELFSTRLFQSSKEKIDTKWKAFKNGFTDCASLIIFSHLPISIIIYTWYLLCIIVSQLYDLGFIVHSEFVSFCKYNEYGILVVMAINEIVKVVKAKKEKRRIDIVRDVLDKKMMENKDKK
jgi:hypothetical protein